MAEKVTFNQIDKLKPEDLKGLSKRNVTKKFGRENDYIEMHIYDQGNNLLYSIQDYKDYKYPDELTDLNEPLSPTVFVDPAKSLSDLGFNSGVYNLIYNFQRKKFFMGFENNFTVDQVSGTRTEIKLTTSAADSVGLENMYNSFIDSIENTPFFKDFLLCFGDNVSVMGVNIALDKSNTDSYALLIKLYEPLPTEIEISQTCRIAEEIISPIQFKVDLGVAESEPITNSIQGPNFRIDTRLNNSIPSQWKVYDDFLEGANSESLRPLLSQLSGSITPTIEYGNTANTDSGYHFENFCNFGSAKERLKNFVYKLELIELYTSQINEINTISGSVSASTAVSGNRELKQQKIEDIITGFDHYENFLYFESHSYAWPKQPDYGIGWMQISGSQPPSLSIPPQYFTVGGSGWCGGVHIKPYTLFPTTASEAYDWLGSDVDNNPLYGGQLYSASMFDRLNNHNLTYTIPEHISMDPNNAQYLLFVNMIGHYFDQIWLYMNHVTKIKEAHNSLKRGISKELVFTALQNLGMEVFDQFENEDLFGYLVAGAKDYTSGSGNQYGQLIPPLSQSMVTSSLAVCDGDGTTMTKGDITKEVWKRLYHNLPYLLKNKGTERGIKALMTCYGVPETILNIKEYGGPVADFTGYKTFNYTKSGLALHGDTFTNNGYFIKAPIQNHYVTTPKYNNTQSYNQDQLLTFRINPYRYPSGGYCLPESGNLYHLCSITGSDPTGSSRDYHLVLAPHTGGLHPSGSDVSSSGDFAKWGEIRLYHSASANLKPLATTSLIPIYDGDFWNIHLASYDKSNPGGTLSSSISESKEMEIHFGAYKDNYLGHTHKYYTITSSFLSASYNISSSIGGDGNPQGSAINTVSQSLYICGLPSASGLADTDPKTIFQGKGYSGSVQQIKYWHGALDLPPEGILELDLTSASYLDARDRLDKILTLHAKDPFMYSGFSPSSSYNSLKLRIPLGSNDMQNSSSFNPHAYTDIELSSSVCSGSLSDVSIGAWKEYTEWHHHPTPDTVGIAMTSEKVRIDSGSVPQNLLSFDKQAESSTQDRQPLDYNDLGIFFSPTTELNEDIVYTMGAFRMDDYIGDPRHQTKSSYPDLDMLHKQYFNKYIYTSGSSGTRRQNMWDYVKLIQYIDHTLFKIIEQYVPIKANLKTGLLIEPNYLERPKFQRPWPIFEDITKSGSISDWYSLPLSQSYSDINLSCEINISDPENDNVKITSSSLRISKSKYDFDATYITMDDTINPLYGNFLSGPTSSVYYNIVTGVQT